MMKMTSRADRLSSTSLIDFGMEASFPTGCTSLEVPLIIPSIRCVSSGLDSSEPSGHRKKAGTRRAAPGPPRTLVAACFRRGPAPSLCRLAWLEGVSHVELHPVEVGLFLTRKDALRACGILKCAVEGAAVPVGEHQLGVLPQLVVHVKAILQGVGRRPLIALIERGEDGICFLPAPL